MASVTLGGSPIELAGRFPAVGDVAPPFTLVGKDLKDVSLAGPAAKRKILTAAPGLDTPVRATSTRRFNERAGRLGNTVVLVVSADLPFAMGRFCTTEGLSNVVPLSTMRGRQFMRDYGVEIASGPLVGVTARGVLVLDEQDRVIHAELVPEIKNEPDYDAALAAAEKGAA